MCSLAALQADAVGLPMFYWKQVPCKALVVAETGGGIIAQHCWIRKPGRQAALAACPICVSFVLSIHVSMPGCAYTRDGGEGNTVPRCNLMYVQETGTHAVPGAESKQILGSYIMFSNAVACCPFSAVSVSWGN